LVPSISRDDILHAVELLTKRPMNVREECETIQEQGCSKDAADPDSHWSIPFLAIIGPFGVPKPNMHASVQGGSQKISGMSYCAEITS
jgi:hypothetical protein